MPKILLVNNVADAANFEKSSAPDGNPVSANRAELGTPEFSLRKKVGVRAPISAAPVSGESMDEKNSSRNETRVILSKSRSLPALESATRVFSGKLPAIPEVQKRKSPFESKQYASEERYRRDLLVLASYNAAGLHRSRSQQLFESPEKKAKQALSEAKSIESKIHNRVSYLAK